MNVSNIIYLNCKTLLNLRTQQLVEKSVEFQTSHAAYMYVQHCDVEFSAWYLVYQSDFSIKKLSKIHLKFNLKPFMLQCIFLIRILSYNRLQIPYTMHVRRGGSLQEWFPIASPPNWLQFFFLFQMQSID